MDTKKDNFLGETLIDISKSHFANYESKDWVLYFIERYGQIPEVDHKSWLIDTIVRILRGTPVKVVLARWVDGTEEYRVSLEPPSDDYLTWVKYMMCDSDYDYDPGIAP